MTWTTVVMTLVLPLVIRGCEVTTLGTHLDKPLQKNGDSWTVGVSVRPNHEDDWQLNLLLAVKEDSRTTFVMNVILNHKSNPRVIRLLGHIGREEITGDDLPSMPRDLVFRIHVTVRKYDLEFELDNVKKAAPHGLQNFHEMRTPTLALLNTDAAEGFSVSHDCVEGNTQNRIPVIAAASCGAAALVMAATWLIYCASRRLRGRPPVNADSCSHHYEEPRPVHALAQEGVRVYALAQGDVSLHEHRSSLEEHIYESASDAEEQMNTDCANCQGRSSEEHIYDSASEKEEPMYTDCADNQRRCSPDEHIYESATDAEESSGSRSEGNSIYGSERDLEAQLSLRNSIYEDHMKFYL